MQSSNYRDLILACLLSLSAFSAALAQKPYFLIQSVKTMQTIKVKRGQFIQCIQKNSFGEESFAFGEVITIRHDGVMLRDNPFIRGSGGFVFYEDIVNIDKVKIVKRSMLPAFICGIALGEISFAFSLSSKIMGPISGIATYFIMDRAVRRKRKSLFKNRVPEAVIVISPGIGAQSDRYFEPSSSLNHPE